MFGFGQRNPQRVAQKQLNQAKLDLLEVSGALENCNAQKSALESRIARLTQMVAAESAHASEQAPVATTSKRERVRSVGNGVGMLSEAS